MRQFNRFRETLINESRNNAAVRGEVAPARPERGVSFVPPSRMLTCSFNAVLKSGDILRSQDGLRYIAGFGGSEQGMLVFNLVDLPEQAHWKRSVTNIDPVTRMPRDKGVPSDLGTIWCMITPKGKVTEAAAKLQVYDIVCGADIHIGDTINGMNVTSVVHQQGVTIAEVA